MTTNLTEAHWLETYKSLISLSIEGFKFSALINGGAAVALLAYLGNVVGKGGVAPDMRCPMAFLLAGLASCGASLFVAYLTQLRLLNEIGRNEKPMPGHIWYLRFAIILFAVSLGLFG